MGGIYSNETECVYNTNRNAKFENDWFDKGASRLAFKGEWYQNGEWNGKYCVVKVFQSEYAENIGHWDADSRASNKAKEMSDAFNRLVQTPKRIKFVIPEIAKIKEVANFKLFWIIPIPQFVRDVSGNSTTNVTNIMNVGHYVALEEFITGNFDKWNSNGGFVNPNLDVETSEAFSHFTYHHSNGEVLVCDIQGVEKSANYLFTDPAIHSKSGPGFYGPTDCGTLGFQIFFEKHRCNDLCKHMRKWNSDSRITNHFQRIGFRAGKRATSYSYEMGLNYIQYGQNNSRRLARLLE